MFSLRREMIIGNRRMKKIGMFIQITDHSEIKRLATIFAQKQMANFEIQCEHNMQVKCCFLLFIFWECVPAVE